MSYAASPSQQTLFFDAPPHRFESWLGLLKPGRPHIVLRTILVAAVSWLPLALLTALRGDFIRPDAVNAFLPDLGALARFVIASPLLVVAESMCAHRLSAIARHFRVGGLVGDSGRPAYDAAVVSTQRLLRLPQAEIGAFALAYLLILAMLLTAPPTVALPGWHGTRAGRFLELSPAGWWGLLVSLPLLLVLLLGSLWRVILWTRFLWLMSKLDLKLIPSHPDRAAGLRFVSFSLKAFLPQSFVLGVIAAGSVANRVVHGGASPLEFKYLCLGVGAFAVMLFGAPLLVFGRRLSEEHDRGVFQYGALAGRMGDKLERGWLATPHPDQETRDTADLSETHALDSIAANVYAMSRLPIEPRDLGLVALAAVLPFVPLALLAVPAEVLIKKMTELFF